MRLVHICAIVLFFLCVQTTAHSVYDNCTSHDTCPAGTTCRCYGAFGYQCLCNQGEVMSRTGHGCVKAALLGEACDENSRCVDDRTYCFPTNNTCACNYYFRLSSNGDLCVPQGSLALNETCTSSGECDILQDCVNGVCTCMAGYRPKTEEEFWAAPHSVLTCIPDAPLNNRQFCPPTTAVSTTTPLTTTPATTVAAASTTAETNTTANATRVFDPCTSDADCPENSTCQIRGCNGQVCACNTGYVASRDRMSCFQGKLINDPCTSDSECVPFFSYCQNTCRCSSYVRETTQRTCAMHGFSTLDEQCGLSADCQDSNTLCSQTGRCQCKPDFRRKTDVEFWNNPYDRTECVPQAFSLDTCETTTMPSTTVARDTKLSDSCTVSEQCPVNAVCDKPAGCSTSVCHCSAGYKTNPAQTGCIRAARVGEQCSQDADCISEMSYCNPSGFCACFFGWHNTRFSCVWRQEIPLGQYCGRSSTLCSDRNAVCSVTGTCQCRPGYHAKTDAEFWLNPTNISECAPDGQVPTVCPSAPQAPQTGSATFVRANIPLN